MSSRNVVSFYTAPARSGKTFRMVVRIVDEILPRGQGMVYTNLPLHIDRIAEYCEEKHHLDANDVRERIHIIPRDVEKVWREAGYPIFNMETGRKTGINPITGPWDYFEDKPLAGSTIIIDEIHNFCGSIGTPKPISNEWQKWLGELGHNQAVFICISQAPEKVHACIKQEAQASYTIRNTGLERDPYFKIEVYDWLELWAGLFNKEYRVFVFEQETQKAEGRKQRGQRKLCRMGPPYFDLYDSFNKPIASEQTDNVKPFEHEYEKHLSKGRIAGRLSLIRWFVTKNFQPLVSRGGMALTMGAVLLYLLSGGAGDLTRYISNTMSGGFPTSQAMAGEVDDGGTEPVAEVTDAAIGAGTRPPAEDERLKQVRETYEEELRKVLTEREQIKQELKAAQEELSRQSAVSLVTPTAIVLKGGHVYEVGQEIIGGDYKGRRLVAVDYRRREAILDDGNILGLAD